MADAKHLKILRRGIEAWNEWRDANHLNRPDLTRANLRDADLTEADLTDANLTHADLSYADLTAADLTAADLTAADLTVVNLTAADLTRADLTIANLTAANLTVANLMDADLTGARLFGTKFNGTALTDARGLAECHHHGPSYLDIQTVERSGRLPEVFLRGVGWPERLIGYLPTLLSGSPIEFYVCFISYASTDRVFARRLHDRLQGCGVRCYLDEEDMKVGNDIAEWIDRRVWVADKLLLCASETSLKSEWVDEKIATARERERCEGKRIIIPLNLDGHLLSDGYRGPFSALLRMRLAADFTGWAQDNAKFEASFEKVMLALQESQIRSACS